MRLSAILLTLTFFHTTVIMAAPHSSYSDSALMKAWCTSHSTWVNSIAINSLLFYFSRWIGIESRGAPSFFLTVTDWEYKSEYIILLQARILRSDQFNYYLVYRCIVEADAPFLKPHPDIFCIFYPKGVRMHPGLSLFQSHLYLPLTKIQLYYLHRLLYRDVVSFGQLTTRKDWFISFLVKLPVFKAKIFVCTVDRHKIEVASAVLVLHIRGRYSSAEDINVSTSTLIPFDDAPLGPGMLCPSRSR